MHITTTRTFGTVFASLLAMVCSTLGACGGVDAAADAGTSAAPFHQVTAREGTIRGVWVTRWDYWSEADIVRAMNDVAGLGMTDVFFQVRGQADAYYRSNLEPWGEELRRSGTTDATGDPGFDPLGVAIREGHRRGLRVHAWINVMPLWKGTTPPLDLQHPLHAHPEWRLADQDGTPQPLNEHYVIVNPLREDVRAHIAAVARDIASRYDIDGLHLDYIRFVRDTMEEGRIYPAGDVAMDQLERRTASRSLDAKAQRDQLRAIIRESVTEIVRSLRRQLDDTRPDAMLTAAVWRRPELARDQYEQDAAAWANDGTVHAVIPMIYTDDLARLDDDFAAWRTAVPDRRVIPGLGIYKHTDPAQTTEQLERAEVLGRGEVVCFAYASMFGSRAPDQEHTPEARAQRERLADAVRTHATSNAR